MKKNIILMALATICAVSISCEKSGEEQATEEEKISEWVEKQMEANTEYSASYNEGVVRLTIVKGEGDELSDGGEVSFHYALYDFSSTAISNSAIIYSNMDSDSITVVLGKDDLLKGLEYGLKGVKSGEECYIVFSSEFGYGEKKTGTIPANTALCYDIKICTVNNK